MIEKGSNESFHGLHNYRVCGITIPNCLKIFYRMLTLLLNNYTRQSDNTGEKAVSKAPFTLLRFCTKMERKTSVFVKVFTLIRTKTPQKQRFLKTLSKVDIHKNGGF